VDSVAGFSLPCGLDIGDWEWTRMWFEFKALSRSYYPTRRRGELNTRGMRGSYQVDEKKKTENVARGLRGWV
jgi:hypothetical protein